MVDQHHQESIKVGVRLRPLVAHEKGQHPCFTIQNSDVSVLPAAVSRDEAKQGPWRFDCVMDSSDSTSPYFVSNKRCYELMGRSMVDHALQGFNACLFCYGQTGTGKTTTILGDRQTGKGVLYLLLEELFEDMRQEETMGVSIQVNVQMLEVYNEKVYDLLDPDQSTRHQIELHVRPGGVQVHGAQAHSVATVEECLELIAQGNKMKHMAATAMNAHSSRGHTIFKLGIQKTEHEEGISLHSDVFFADLAGHENEKTTKVTGDRMIELSFINKSLMWLQSAIHSLAKAHSGKASAAKGKSHVPDHVRHLSEFRNSKLTMLLSNALSGNSRVNVIVTLSPAHSHFATSVSSLRFADEVKRIKVDVHSSAHADPHVQIKKLEHEIQSLKEQLALAQTGNPIADLNGTVRASGRELELLRKREQTVLSESNALREELQSQGAREQALASEIKALRSELQARDSREQKLVSDYNAVRGELQARDAREQKLILESRALRDQLQAPSPIGLKQAASFDSSSVPQDIQSAFSQNSVPHAAPAKPTTFSWEDVDTDGMNRGDVLPQQTACSFDNPFQLVYEAVAPNNSDPQSACRSSVEGYRRTSEHGESSELAVSPFIAKSFEALNAKVENLAKELRARDSESNHLTGERDRIAGFLQSMIDRLGSNESCQQASPSTLSRVASINSPPVPLVWQTALPSWSDAVAMVHSPPAVSRQLVAPPQRASHPQLIPSSLPRGKAAVLPSERLSIGKSHSVTVPVGTVRKSTNSVTCPVGTGAYTVGTGQHSVALPVGTCSEGLQLNASRRSMRSPRRYSPERKGPPRHSARKATQ